MVKVSRAAILILACAATVPMAGCAKDRKKGDTQYVARDVATLYSAAKRQMVAWNPSLDRTSEFLRSQEGDR